MLPVIALAIFGVALMLYVLACFLFFLILEEVNRKRLPGDQISKTTVKSRIFEVIRLHKQTYPQSPKRTVVYVCVCLGLTLSCFSFAILASLRLTIAPSLRKTRLYTVAGKSAQIAKS